MIHVNRGFFMFFLVLLFLIFGSVFALFRFPNLASRLRLPRFNFANGFRNPKIKTLLNDRYFFYQNTTQISKGPLFVVVGKNTDKLYQILFESVYGKENKESANVQWADRGQNEAFAILTIDNVHYLFIHPALIDKAVGESFNSRTRFLIDRLCHLRKKNLIDGILFAANHTAFLQKAKQSFGISEEISYCTHVFELFAKTIKVRLPIFYIEHNFSVNKSDELNDATVNYKNTHDKVFGFSCDFSNKSSSQKQEDFLTEAFGVFSHNFNVNFNYDAINKKYLEHEFESISAMYSVKYVNALIIKFILVPFLKSYTETGECSPASIHILNSTLFHGTNEQQRINQLFLYLSHNAVGKFVVPESLLKSRSYKNQILFVIACFFSVVFTFSIVRSEQFLTEKRSKFEKTIENFQNLDNSMQLLLNKNDDLDSLAELQETSCLIIKNYSDIKNISFRSVFLFPSWNSKISIHLQKKYKDKFSLIFSDFLFEKYANILDNFFELKDFPLENAPSSEYLKYINTYVRYLSDYKDIYNQLESNESTKINKGLILISKNIYENKCVEDENSFDFLTKIDQKNFKNFIKPPTAIQKQASKALSDMMKKYFSSVLNNNTLMTAALNLNNDLKEFDHLVESIEDHMNLQDENDLSGVKSAFIKSLEDYKILMGNFPDEKPKVLSSSNDFFGSDFISLIENIKKNQIFDSLSLSEINVASKDTFESFKYKMNISSILEEKNNFPILKFDEKSNLYVNQKIINLFTAFGKFINLSNTNLSVKTNYTDFHHLAANPSANIVWVDRKLQVAVQKYKDMQDQSNIFEFDTYPDVFSEYLQDFILNYFEKYWSQALLSAANVFENNTTSTDELNLDDTDPHGIISSGASLKQIVEFLIAEHFDNVLSDFDEIYLRQINDVLKQKTILFDKKELFGENADFKFWDGTTSLSYDIFYSSSDETLTENLEKQKQILFNFYGQYVESSIKSIIPIMQLRPHLRSSYYNRWYSIYLAIEDKTKSYQNFQSFVFNDLKKFRLNDCPKILENSRDSALISDYFDSRTEYLYGKLNERCRVIYMNTAISGYEDFARTFNELLANKYPFSKFQTNDQNQISADIQDLKTVLNQFQSFNKEKLSFLLKYNQKFSERTDIISFISQMTKINSFFQNIVSKQNTEFNELGATVPNHLKLDGYFIFRSRKNEESLANHIIDWELKIGEDYYGSAYGNLQNTHFSIEYGQPFMFSMKLADNLHPKQLTLSDKNTMKIIRGNSVSLSFKTTWALIRFLDEYKTCTDSMGFCNKEKLKFQIPLENGENLVLFCDLILMDPEGNKISLPSFPFRAPYFADNINIENNRSMFSSSNF